MDRSFLSFQSANGGDAQACAPTGDMILARLAAGLRAQGFAVDFSVGQNEPDWLLRAQQGHEVCIVVLALRRSSPCRWFISLEDEHARQLQNDSLREQINPLLEAIIIALPDVAQMRWHRDFTSLRDL